MSITAKKSKPPVLPSSTAIQENKATNKKRYVFIWISILSLLIPLAIFITGIYFKTHTLNTKDFFYHSYQKHKNNEIISMYLIEKIASNIYEKQDTADSHTFIQLLQNHIHHAQRTMQNNNTLLSLMMYYKYLLGLEFLALHNTSYAQFYLNDIIHNYDLLKTSSSKKMQNILYNSLTQLSAIEQDPYTYITTITLLLQHFNNRIPNKGNIYYFLGKHYDDTAQWNKAYTAYQNYLSYDENNLILEAKEMREDIFLRIRRRVLSRQKNSTTWENASAARTSILQTLYSYNSVQIKRLQSPIFFTAHWFEKLTDSNTFIPNFDIKPILTRSNISVAKNFSPYSTENTKLWKTSGWGRVPVWYFVIKKIALPDRPDINGKWEWVGIYFGVGNERYIPSL